MSLLSKIGTIITGVKLNSKACQLAQNEQFDRALAVFDELIKMAPEFADGHYNRGNAYAQKGLAESSTADFDRAIADYDEAIRLDPKHADYFVSRGSWYLKKGQFDRAVFDYTDAIKLNPRDVV